MLCIPFFIFVSPSSLFMPLLLLFYDYATMVTHQKIATKFQDISFYGFVTLYAS